MSLDNIWLSPVQETEFGGINYISSE